MATSAYRSLIARTLGSRCKMWPSDSRYFDRTAARCAPIRTVVRSAARLFVERAAAPRFLSATVHDRRLVWFDPPTAWTCER